MFAISVIRHAFKAAIPLLVIGFLPAIGCQRIVAPGSAKDLRSSPIHSFSERKLDLYLRELSSSHPDPLDRLLIIANQTLGQRYRLGPLGEFPFELIDPDPLYNLSESDCVTFVEQTWAMALSHNWAEFMDRLIRLRYKNGKIGILTRNHFTEADWNPNNAVLFEDVTGRIMSEAARPFSLRIDRRAFFNKLGVEVDMPVQEWQDQYLPRERLDQALPDLHSGDIIEFVKNASNPHVSHLGLLERTPAGGVYLIHATRPVVRREPLTAYMAGKADLVGVKILRFRGFSGA